jgi:hypothetical protein
MRLKSLETERAKREREKDVQLKREQLVQQHRSRSKRVKSMPAHSRPEKPEMKTSAEIAKYGPSKKRSVEYGEHREGSSKFNDKYVLD